MIAAEATDLSEILPRMAGEGDHAQHGGGGDHTLGIAGGDASPSIDLPAIIANLATPRQAIDGAFVAVGDRLAECAEILSRITGTFDALPVELAGEELTIATDRLALVGRRAGEIAVALGAEQGDLNRLVEALRRAAHPIDELRRTVKMMGIVAINARVVAASVVSETEDFGVFTTDIAQLSSSAAATISKFHRTYEALTGVVADAAVARGSFEASHRDTLSALAGELERDLSEVTEQRLESARSSAVTSQMSRAIAEKVAAAVMALQVGDATRQRVEHVEAALVDLAGLEPGIDPSPILDLQRQQLAAARESLVGEMASGAEALEQLVHDVQAVLDHAGAVYGSAENRSALAQLHGAVRRAVTVLRDCESERGKLDQVAAAVSETVQVLLGHVEAVQEIEYKMRLVSLNAAVKCAQLGPRGRALDVIAQQLRTLTGETVVSAHAAVECLTQASEFSAAFTRSAGSGATRVGDIEREATAALSELEAVGFRMKNALVELYADGPQVASRLGDAVSALAGHAAISEAFSDIEFALVLPDGAAGAEIDPALEPLLATMRRRYTMDAERRLHDGFTGIAPEAEPEPAAEADLDDLLF
jgi:hypothetical protein